MVSLQIISKILATKDSSIITDNMLTEDFFIGYTDEYRFIIQHEKDYGSVPDRATFLSKFPDVELVEVTESDRYLVDTIREEYLYYKSVPVVQKIAELLKTDSNAAAEYMINAVKELQPQYRLGGVDIISQAEERYKQFIDRKENQDEWFFTTGFEELDDLIHGIQREEELFVIFARTNQGKSWVLEKICTHIWEIGFNVGYISPEMGSNSVGYRFDTLYRNFSNRGLMWGKDDIDAEEYLKYINTLKTTKNRFITATPPDFDRKITVTKLRNWIKEYRVDILAIDGIKYLSDERYKRGDNLTTSLTNISEDLMALSIELHIPVLVVVQSNRSGVVADDEDDTPDLESIRDSDGISHNASKVLSLRQTKDGILKMGIKKSRFGSVGGKLNYQWDIDTGEFVWLPADDDASQPEHRSNVLEHEKRKFSGEKSEVF